MKFSVEQRMRTAEMLLQEVRNWQGGQGVLPGFELYTDLDFDTAVAIPRDYECDVRECVFSKSTRLLSCLVPSGVLFIFLVTVMPLLMIYA